jgi:hypothetical protein
MNGGGSLSFPIEIFFTTSSTRVRRGSFFYQNYIQEREEATLPLFSSSSQYQG